LGSRARNLIERLLMSPLWLKSLPWSTIISNAPLIVDGAKKLVSLVKSKPAAEEVPLAPDTFTGDPRSELISLRARIQRLEEEQRQAAELIRAMAESQAQMTRVVDALRARVRLSVRVAVISLVGVAVLLLWHLTR
jgi:hypothetical protein